MQLMLLRLFTDLSDPMMPTTKVTRSTVLWLPLLSAKAPPTILISISTKGKMVYTIEIPVVIMTKAIRLLNYEAFCLGMEND